jgi:phosphoglycolate phosphatase-like HAD superfamily hydrolase
MHTIKAVLFDFDGTLVNSLKAFLIAARLTLKSLGLPLLSREKLVEIVKLPFDEWLSIIIPLNAPERASIVDRFKSDYEKFYRKNHLKLIKPINNAFLTLERLREMGLSIGS